MWGTNLGTPMPVVTSTVNVSPVLHAVDAADARAGVGENFELIAGMRAESFRHPRGHAACAVAAEFGDRAVGVVQADAAGVGPGPFEEFDAVCADAGVARAKAARELGARSWSAAAFFVTIRKSLPQAWALVKGINLPPN